MSVMSDVELQHVCRGEIYVGAEVPILRSQTAVCHYIKLLLSYLVCHRSGNKIVTVYAIIVAFSVFMKLLKYKCNLIS